MGKFSKQRIIITVFACGAVAVTGLFALQADDTQTQSARVQDSPELKVEHAECTMFGAQRERHAQEARQRYALSAATDQVTRMIVSGRGSKPAMQAIPRSAGAAPDSVDSSNIIDTYVFQAIRAAGIAAAEPTTDFEFIRRVSLDLTGRIPTVDRLTAFVNDSSPDKRSKLVDELMSKPEYVDKWTMYFGDRFKNASNKPSSGTRMFDEGRNAFYEWIKDSVASNKPYDQVAAEIIAARGSNTYEATQGAANWLVGGIVANGPVQDIWDQQTANIAETFLGIAHVNCLLCHDGRRHLDSLSLWAKSTTRRQAWQLSAFLSKTTETRGYPDAANRNVYYWSITENPRAADYALNTTTGNRPARQPVGAERNVAPVYIFTGEKPSPAENYRDALARFVTKDPQFARATVNYLWKEFFGRGIVEPANQFDPARLDASAQLDDPWSVQPSNPQLLEALTQDFIASKFDLKHLIRLIATSQAYQLSSRYNGQWNPQWEGLFARKLVRRLWGEEVMDALAQSSNILPNYTVNTYKFNFAMQSPEPGPLARGNNVLAAFMPGNRDDQERKTDGAVQQGLAMMNDAMVMTRTRSSGGANASLLAKNLGAADDILVVNLYLNVLSRYPTGSEKATALAALKSGNRTQKAEDLLWSLYNKVDFLFNY